MPKVNTLFNYFSSPKTTSSNNSNAVKNHGLTPNKSKLGTPKSESKKKGNMKINLFLINSIIFILSMLSICIFALFFIYLLCHDVINIQIIYIYIVKCILYSNIFYNYKQFL